MPGPSNETEQVMPSGRERRPSEKVVQLAEARQEKENARQEAAERAEQRKKKKAVMQQKAAQREQAGNNNRQMELNYNLAQRHNTITGRDPGFSSSSTLTSQSSQSNLRRRTSVVPTAPHNNVTATPGITKRIASRQSITDDDIDSDNDVDNGINKDNDDIDNDDDDDINNNIDGANNTIHEGLGSNVDSNDFGNQLEEQGDQDNEDDGASPSVGDKRRHSQLRKPVKVYVTTGARPKAHDYEVAVQKVLNEAITLYCGYLSTVTPYPGPIDEIRWAKKSWKDACEMCEILMAPNDEIIKLITSRSSHFRSRIKTKVQPLVKTMYGFIANSKSRPAEYNSGLAQELKNKFNFYYAKRKGDKDRQGIYRHPIIQQSVNAVWFNNKKSDGARLPDIYNPFPKVALALILTTIENCIDEWANDTHASIAFTQDAYENIFNEHLEELKKFDECTKTLKILPILLQELHDEGRINARADPLEQPKQRAQSPNAYAAAMEEFKNGGYRGSDASEEV